MQRGKGRKHSKKKSGSFSKIPMEACVGGGVGWFFWLGGGCLWENPAHYPLAKNRAMSPQHSQQAAEDGKGAGPERET